jgi:hypothetical protein
MPLTARLNIGISAHPALYRSRREVDWVTGAFCIARREAGDRPSGVFMYGEDVAWALKQVLRGTRRGTGQQQPNRVGGRASTGQSRGSQRRCGVGGLCV